MKKTIKFKKLLIIYGCIAIFMLMLFLGLLNVFFIYFSFVPFAALIVLTQLFCRCPHCGTTERLDRLTYARKHVHHCRGCGEIIEIED